MEKNKYDFNDLIKIMSILRGENGCPWDRAQTYESMKKYMLEEPYEAIQAIEDKDSKEMCEEFGDVLLQVVFQSRIAKEDGLFDINDVTDGICRKMIKRHPHIFGGENSGDYKNLTADDNSAFLGKWEDNKKNEKGYETQTDVLKAIPKALPALMRADKVVFKAENAGVSYDEIFKNDKVYNAIENEIGELKNLSAHFNIMADKLQEQMEEIRRNECERQQMEKKLLQSQINPHFLYNTLDSIIWMIRSEEYEGAGKMVSLLAKFFRISLSQGKDMIPLEKELEHASSYLAIQNIRFKDKFEFQIEADPALLKYLCPKLSIQPLLENAIYHGMEGMYEDGEITIRIYDRDGDIGIDVADNGPGMTQETIDHIMHNKVISSKRGSGIGVRNVNERIQLIYGEDYGVTITSELDEGTTATITIPKMEETDDAR